MNNYIKVYAFEDAPKELQYLSTNGGDEDWLAIVPPNFFEPDVQTNPYPFWIEAMDSCRDPKWYDMPNHPGWKIVIGSHA